MKSIFVRITVATVVVFMVGAAMMWPAQNGSAKQQLIETAHISQQAYSLYRKGGYATAKAALSGHIEYLDRLTATSARPNANPAAVDAMIFTVRLAKLEEKHGGADKAKYMQDASARCTKLQHPWQNCSENILRQKVDQMDQWH
ncbi:MAG: hypothetical protein JNM09_04245 [Blastocatellia bacterium]|nr:hypothetical protein [Blastocatellia bacterium]